MKFYPYKKEGDRKGFRHAEGRRGGGSQEVLG